MNDWHNPSPSDSAESVTSSTGTTGRADSERVEALLAQIRDALNGESRELAHKEFSIARLAGAIATAIVVGLLLWSFADCIFAQTAWTMAKLGFAIALQLVALTAIVYDQQRKSP